MKQSQFSVRSLIFLTTVLAVGLAVAAPWLRAASIDTWRGLLLALAGFSAGAVVHAAFTLRKCQRLDEIRSAETHKFVLAVDPSNQRVRSVGGFLIVVALHIFAVLGKLSNASYLTVISDAELLLSDFIWGWIASVFFLAPAIRQRYPVYLNDDVLCYPGYGTTPWSSLTRISWPDRSNGRLQIEMPSGTFRAPVKLQTNRKDVDAVDAFLQEKLAQNKR